MMWSLISLLLGSAGLADAVHLAPSNASGVQRAPAPKWRSGSDQHFKRAAPGPLPSRAERAGRAPKPSNSFDLMGNLKKIPCNPPGKLDHGESFGSLVRDGAGAMLFEDEPLAPVHIFYRFHGQSVHDLPSNNTPALAVTSLLNTLKTATAAQRASTNLYMLVNGASGVAHKAWLHQMLDNISLESMQIIDTPEGAEQSYKFMVGQMQEVRDLPDAIVLMMEDDYLVHPEMLTRLVEFWSLYAPCSAVPYEDPDYYLHRQKRNARLRHHATVLRTPGIFWRTVGWSTGTIALRLDLFHHLHSKFLLPVGKSDTKSWVKWVRQYGIWAPMPVLASEMHMDSFPDKQQGQSFDPDFDYLTYMKELQAEALEMGFYISQNHGA